MKNYKVDYQEDRIIVSYKHLSVVIHDPTADDVNKVKEIVSKSDNFRYVYRAIVTNPNFIVETKGS